MQVEETAEGELVFRGTGNLLAAALFLHVGMLRNQTAHFGQPATVENGLPPRPLSLDLRNCGLSVEYERVPHPNTDQERLIRARITEAKRRFANDVGRLRSNLVRYDDDDQPLLFRYRIVIGMPVDRRRLVPVYCELPRAASLT